MKMKQCTNCKEYKNISDFSYRNITTKKENKKRLLSICKECNNLKSKEYYYKNKHKHINYVYRFLNKNEEVIYVGKTETDLRKRISGHFTRGHLPKECYEETSKIQFLASVSSTMMDIKEIYYINLYKPKYNTNYRSDENHIIIRDFQQDK